MAVVLCLDDGTYASFERIAQLEAHGVKVMVAADEAALLSAVAISSVDAVLLDCHNTLFATRTLAAAVKRVRPSARVLMLASYCGVPCDTAWNADGCLQKGDIAGLLTLLGLGVQQPPAGRGDEAA
jgi:DNA-binding NtrC family response regulator